MCTAKIASLGLPITFNDLVQNSLTSESTVPTDARSLATAGVLVIS